MPAGNQRISHKIILLDLSVVIVNYNVKCFLEQCLLSVEKAIGGMQAEVWVVDNHSSDGSIEFLKPRFPKVRFVENQQNEGFARANNSVMKELTGEFVLFLNPDTLVPEDCFRQCIGFLRAHADAGGLGVRMIDGSGQFLPESKRSFPSPWSAFFKVTGIHHVFPRSSFFSSYYAVQIPETGSGRVDVLSGAFFMARRNVLYEAGGFDTDYFMYGEDIDLSFRLHKSGYLNYYLGSVTIIHFKGESTNKQTPAHIHNFYGAMTLFVKKHYKGSLSFMMKTGILFSKTMAYLSMVISSRISKAVPPQKRRIFFIGSEVEMEQTYELVKKSGTDALMIDRSAEMPPQAIPEGINTFILHHGVLSFKQIIQLTNELPSGTERLIRAEGSNSLVGSGRKNERGIVIQG